MSQTNLLVLASSSPRRRELLALAGWTFNIAPAEIDETPYLDEMPRQYVQRMADSKAQIVGHRQSPEILVLAADTIVVDSSDGREQILGKPANPAQATEMLRQLRGHEHTVYTALSLSSAPGNRPLTDLCATPVPMRDYTDLEIEEYVASSDPLDKAGAYAIQHPGFKPVTNLQGCYANVVGLPLCHLVRTMDKLGIQPQTDVPAACQAFLSYTCPIYQRVLSGQY